MINSTVFAGALIIMVVAGYAMFLIALYVSLALLKTTQKIIDTSRNILDACRAGIATRNYSPDLRSSLLRAGVSPDEHTKELLRPASNICNLNPQEMLRSVEDYPILRK